MRKMCQTLIKIDGEYLFIVQDENNINYYEQKVPQSNSKILINNLNEQNGNEALKNNNYFRKYIKVETNQSNNFYYYFEYKPHTISLSRFIDQLEKKKIKDEKLILEIIYQIIEALQVLHSQELMGRVFNTQNIIINEDDKKITMMNFGFGSQIIFNQQNQQSEREDPTISLMPFTFNNNDDQNSQSDQIYNEKLDIWLLGCVLYHLMTHKEFNQSEIQQNIKQNEESMIKVYNSQSYSQELRNLLRDMLTIQQLNRIDFYDLVNNQLFAQRPNIQSLREYYKKFYKGCINDKKKISEYINKDYGDQFYQTKDLRMICIILQYRETQEQNSQDIFKFKELITDQELNQKHKLQLHKLVANLKFQNNIYLLKDHQLINTSIFVLRKIFIYQVRQIIRVLHKENKALIPDWQQTYDQYFNTFQNDYKDTDLNKFYYCQNLKKQFDDDEYEYEICLSVLIQLGEKFQQLNGINFNKYYQLLNADQIEQFNSVGSELRII